MSLKYEPRCQVLVGAESQSEEDAPRVWWSGEVVKEAGEIFSVALAGNAKRPLQRVELHRSYLTESVYKVVLQMSIPSQIHQLVLHVSNNTG